MPGETTCGNCGNREETTLYVPPCCIVAAQQAQRERDAKVVESMIGARRHEIAAAIRKE